jgi:phosphate ABC transporter phosphate-binding protein
MIGDTRTASVSREQFLQNVKDSGLSLADDIQRVVASLTETDGDALAQQLVGRGDLTAYQASALLQGRVADLRIGGYEVLDLLGQGAMGTVYRARHRTMKRVAAIKVLAPEVAKHESFAQRFQREVETLARLHHPNIIMAFDAGESPAGPFLAMEFVQGRDLAREVQAAGPLGLADSVACILQAARGLEYAHEQGLIHRDVKPANLMRDVRGVVKVADLGLARMRNLHAAQSESALTQAGSIVGTVDYLAPEQAVDSTTVDYRADIYSLGCTLYYLLTGRPMFSGSSLMSLLLQHREAPPPSLLEARPGVPDLLNAVYLRMVAKDPNDRYASMTEVALALEEAAQLISTLPPSALLPPSAQTGGTSVAENTVVFPPPGQATDPGSPASPQVATLVVNRLRAPTVVRPPSAPSPVAQPEAPPLPASPQHPPSAPRPNRGVLLAAAILAGLLVVAAGIWWQFPRSVPSGKETQTSQPKPPETRAKQGPFTGTILQGGGSTFINPLMQHWAGVYEKAHGVRIDYQTVGSGRGMEGVLDRVYVFGCSDAPLTDKQLARVKEAGGHLIHVPLVLGAVVPAYNLPGIGKGQLRFTGPILADIYLGKITNWNSPALRIANPGIKLPDMPIRPVHRIDKSGTTYIWTEYLSTVSGEWKARFGASMQLDWPGGLEGKGNNAVANQVSRTVGSLGYVELTYALENNLPFGQVKNREGKFITATLDSVTAAAGALTTIPADLRLPLIDAAGEDTYPIVGMTYALIHSNQAGNPSGRDLVAFLRWATHEGQAYTRELHYAPLPPELVRRIDMALASVKRAP